LVDRLPASLMEGDPLAQITYAVEVLNSNGRSAGLSNQVRVPAAPTLPPPTGFTADVQKEGVLLGWQGMTEPHQVASIAHSFYVYRHDEQGAEVMLGSVPLSGSARVQFLDRTFEWEKTYTYRATVVTLIAQPTGETVPVEGDDTEPVSVKTNDVFPPAVPAELQAVFSGAGQRPFVDLIWAPVTDADLAGYNVYRREEGAPAVKLNPSPVGAPAYRDTSVTPGRHYIYSVAAIDVRGNESARSEEAGESVP
jgi:hypothetical protein